MVHINLSFLTLRLLRKLTTENSVEGGHKQLTD